MIAMRLCAALALVLVALVVVTVKAARRHPRPSAASIEQAPAEPPRAAARAPARVTAPPSAPFEPGGIAHLRGRLLFPSGVEPTSSLDVVAEGAVRKFRALIPEDDRGYEIHLPSGRYALVASMGELVGVVPDVLARAGASQDVDIRLAVGAVIRGRVKAPPSVRVRASAPGKSDELGDAKLDDDGRFSIAGLIPGRRYDVIFDGSNLRSSTIRGVTAPADGLDVEVVPLARVRGAIGFPRGQRCPITSARLRLGGDDTDDDDHSSDNVGGDCRFELVVPDDFASVTVLATGNGWHLAEDVAIPPTGDPEPICLNPPCRSDPTAGLANLHIFVDVREGSWRQASAMEVGPTTSGIILGDCDKPGGMCVIEGLPTGKRYRIKGRGDSCLSDVIETAVVAGDNEFRLSCREQRQVEGVVRVRAGEQPEDIGIRCAGSDERQFVVNTHFFYLSCNVNTASVEYQIGERGSWHSVPIATASNPALVDIDL